MMTKTNVIDRVKNSTLAKLTKDEIGELGLCNEGVGLYRGDLKTRYNGMTRKSEDGVTFWFENKNGTARMEFTEIVNDSDDGVRHWAARLFNIEAGRYETYPMGIAGCGYFR